MALQRDISLAVSAKISAFQKEMGKLPGITDKKATQAALKMQTAFIKAENKAAKSAKKAGKEAAKGFGDSFKGITFAFNTADIQAAAVFVVDMAQQTADLRNQLTDTGARADVFAETVGGLRLAFEGSGLAASKLEGLLLPLPKRFDDARRGVGEAVDGFDRLGFTVEELNGPFKNNNALLLESIKRTQGVEDASERAGIEMAIFGRQGTALTQALGTTDLQLFIDQAERFGVGVGPEAAESAAQWQRAMAALSLSTQGATAGLSDFFDLTGFVERASENLIFVTALVDNYVESVSLGARTIAAAVSGDFARLRGLIELQETTATSIGEVVAAAQEEALAFRATNLAIAEGASTQEDKAAAASAASKATASAADASKELAAQEKAASKAARENMAAASKAASERAKQQREAEKAARDRTKALEAQFKAVGQLVEAGSKSAEAFLDEREQIDVAVNQEIARLEELKIKAGSTAVVQVAFIRAVAAARAAAALESAKIDLDEAERFDEMLRDAEKAADDAKKKAESDAEEAKSAREGRAFDVIELAQNVADTIVAITAQQVAKTQALLAESMTTQMADIERLREAREAADEADKASITAQIGVRRAAGQAERKELDQSLRKRKRAALAAFRASQGAALVEIAVRTAINAVALNAPPPIGLGPGIGAIFAIAAGAAGAAAVVAQSPPKFFAGTGRGGAPDAGLAELHKGEGVASNRTMQIEGFPEFLEAANQMGKAAGGSRGPVQAIIPLRTVTAAMLHAMGGDGDFGAALSRSAPGQVQMLR